MRNPEVTREKILKQSGTLFNTRGYKATSIGDITKATGLTKGAIYRHFKSKAGLEKETLAHLSGIMVETLRDEIKSQPTAGKKLRAIFRFFETYISKPVVKGGCPLMNAAVEADDAHPQLRKRAITLLDLLCSSIESIIDKGIKYGQLKSEVDKQYYATVIVAGLEGAIMMSKLRGNDEDIRRVTKHLENLITEMEL